MSLQEGEASAVASVTASPEPLRDDEIIDWCRDQGIELGDRRALREGEALEPQGMVMRDEITDNMDGLYLINLDEREGKGTHWVGFYSAATEASADGYDKGSKGPQTQEQSSLDVSTDTETFYFDPLGLPPPQELTAHYKPLTYNTNQIQDVSSTLCGYFVCLFFKFMHKYEDKYEGFYAMTHGIFGSDTKENERVLLEDVYDVSK